MTEHHQPTPESAEPVAWVRRHPDGALTAEFLEHAAIEPVRQRSGAWVPLYAAPVAAQAQPFQARVQPWMMQCFGAEIAGDRSERNHRFLEESLELVQACGCTASEAHQLVDYVFNRPCGDPVQEVGGVMVTLAALCLAQGLDMQAAAETELARIWTKVDQIRAKQASKPKHSPLPQQTVSATDGCKQCEESQVCGLSRCMECGTVLHPTAAQPSGNAGELPDTLVEKIEDLLRDFADDPEAPYRDYAEQIASLATQAQPPASQSLSYEQALFELIDKIDPGLDTGDLLADAATASKTLSAQQASDPRTPSDMLVNGGALKMALNVLRRAGKTEVADELEKTAQQDSRQDRPLIARALADWHEDDGPVAWWAWCGHEWAGEPAWIGTPLCSDWPGYHTHWTAHPTLPEISARAATKEQS